MQSIITKKSKQAGKTVAIFAGIHGNETAGIMVVEELIKNFTPTQGTVHLVFGNPRAIAQNCRYTESNLNRDFIRTSKPKTYEQKRAQTLMNLLDSCDTLLDLHAYRTSKGTGIPFAICEPRCQAVVKKFGLPLSIAGISSFQAGSTNGYMEEQNKIGIVVELGALEKPQHFFTKGMECALAFLAHFGCAVDQAPLIKTDHTEYLKVAGVYRKNTTKFKFSRKYHSFDKVTKMETIATDSAVTISTTKPGRIMFPSANDPLGIEAFWLLRSAK